MNKAVVIFANNLPKGHTFSADFTKWDRLPSNIYYD